MRNFKVEDGYKTTDLNIASMLLCQEGSSFGGLEEFEKKVESGFDLESNSPIYETRKEFVIVVKGDPEMLEKKEKLWFQGKPVVGNIKEFSKRRKSLLDMIKSSQYGNKKSS